MVGIKVGANLVFALWVATRATPTNIFRLGFSLKKRLLPLRGNLEADIGGTVWIEG
jgi:hypothetical protein